MSNDDGKNFIMKIHIFLIVLDFIQLCVSIQTNISIDHNPTDPTLLRYKRQLTEYTRWRSNPVTKREFIVKVDDDAFNPMPTPSGPSSVIGINIQPATMGAEKIIVGGAIVPQLKTTPMDLEMPNEYTRFVAPTTVKTTANDDVYPQLKPMHGLVPPFGAAKHSNRDESPPAGPQFIPRMPALARQYAPITPVAFYPRFTEPATPETVPPEYVSRSQPPPPLEHTRTTLEPDLNLIRPILRDTQDLESFFLPLDSDDIPSRTRATSSFITTMRTWNEETEAIPTKSTINADLDAYHMMFYSDEDNEIGDSKKRSQESKKDNENSNKQENLNEIDDENSKKENLNESDESEENSNELAIDVKKNRAENDGLSSITKIYQNSTSEFSISLENMRTPKLEKLHRRQICSLLKYRQLSFNSPPTLPEIVVQLKKWEERSPIAKAIDITASNLTTMDNPIYMMIVDDPSSGQVLSAKDIVMIVGGIQGRDHHAVSAAMYVLHQLIERTEAHADLLNKYRFWIIPVFNPDGYDYSMTFAQRREWTKNLHQEWEVCNGQKSCKDCDPFGIRCTPQPCYGVHLDRNFEYQWIPAEELRAEHPCGDLYAGSRQLSERETRALTTFLHESKTPISMFIAFKEGDVLGVMYPYSHTRKKRAFDPDYRKRASRAASAAYTISGRPYVAGQTSEFLPLYAGGMEDWVDGHLGIDNTYTIMMFRPTDSYNAKLMTEHVVHEAYAALDTLLLETGNTLGAEAKQVFQVKAAGEAARRSPSRLLPFPALLVLLIFNS